MVFRFKLLFDRLLLGGMHNYHTMLIEEFYKYLGKEQTYIIDIRPLICDNFNLNINEIKLLFIIARILLRIIFTQISHPLAIGLILLIKTFTSRTTEFLLSVNCYYAKSRFCRFTQYSL